MSYIFPSKRNISKTNKAIEDDRNNVESFLYKMNELKQVEAIFLNNQLTDFIKKRLKLIIEIRNFVTINYYNYSSIF